VCLHRVLKNIGQGLLEGAVLVFRAGASNSLSRIASARKPWKPAGGGTTRDLNARECLPVGFASITEQTYAWHVLVDLMLAPLDNAGQRWQRWLMLGGNHGWDCSGLFSLSPSPLVSPFLLVSLLGY
jgi:hypothetical protein